ncbi:30S ribosomal protein S8 [Candidatus Woesearchaeota archaeon]|nr:30S ribosomal protein S8 [Candidatus Woesearchaeota archaeon]
MLNDPLANVMSHILNCEKKGKNECLVKPDSKLVRQILTLLKTTEYIKNFEVLEERRGGLIKVELSGSINGCGVVKPRFSVKRNGYEKYEKRFLPAANFGFLVVSTSRGVVVHKEAIKNNLGGKLLAYCY